MAKSFTLPRGWYRETVERLVRQVLPPVLGPLTAETAWRYLYACVLWTEELGGTPYLHLNDQLSTEKGKDLARRGAAYLSRNLTPMPRPADVVSLVDHVGRAYADERHRQGFAAPKKRDPNVTGSAFEATVQVLVHELCGVLAARTPELRTLRGFELAPVGYHSRPDLALFDPRDFRLLISTKWTLRKERIGTYLHEAYFYKQRRSDLQVAFVVSEFNLNILHWLANDPLVDRVYHTHLPMLLAVHEPFRDVPDDGMVEKSRLLRPSPELRQYARWLALSERLFDLSQLFADVQALRPDAPASSDPEREGADGDDEEIAGLW